MNRKYTWILLLSTALIMVVVLANKSPKPGELIRKGPYTGMVYIPGGTFVYGHSGPGLSSSGITQPRQITITPFYMDETEVTNARYREFVHWVRDSILVKGMGMSQFLMEPNADGDQFIDWRDLRRNSPWTSNDQTVRAQVSGMFYQGQEQIYGRNEYNVRLFRYDYDWYDLPAAIANRNNPTFSRADYIRKESTLIYPDTTVWLADFSYSQNEPMVQGYFSHASYSDYPVVGVSWKQAEAFNHWRTKMFEDAEAIRMRRNPQDKTQIQPFSLPSEADWQYAATANAGSGVKYPWGSHSARHGGGFLNANFKPGRGNYVEDGFAYTSPARSFYPNDFGLYDMAGNVAEWTGDAFDESASIFVHDLNPFYKYNANADDPKAAKRKVVKGGSWKDTQDYIAIDSRTYEYQDSSRSFIGFRSINRP